MHARRQGGPGPVTVGALGVLLLLAVGCAARRGSTVIAAAPPAVASCRAGEGLLFEVTDPRRPDVPPLMLFGSVHAGNAAMYPLAPAVERAFERADGLAVEVDPRPSAAQTSRMEAGWRLPEGVRVCDVVDTATCSRLRPVLARLGVDPASVDTWKPWAVAIFVQQRQLAQLGLPPAEGVELYFLRRATAQKRLATLETIDSQTAALNALSAAAQAALLADALRDPPEMAREMRTLLAAWCAGDAAALEAAFAAEADAEPSETALREQMIVARNQPMAGALAVLMQGPERWFAVVGAAHLVGRHSIPDALRERGYIVRRLDAGSPVAMSHSVVQQ